MACFVVTAAEAAVVTVLQHRKAHQEMELSQHESEVHMDEVRIPMSRRLGWLSNMLWGGSALLAFEHIWHGEVTLYPPFLTAMSNAADTMAMLQEMATAGVGMAVLVTIAWAIGCKVVETVAARDAGVEES